MPNASFLARARAMTLARAARSARFRTMRLLGRFDVVRDLTGYDDAPPVEARSSLFPDVALERLRADLRADGFAQGIDLPPRILERLLAYAQATPCYGDHDRGAGFFVRDRARAEAATGRTFTVASYVNTERCDAVAELRDDPLVRAVARRVIGPSPVFLGAQMWWSFPRPTIDEASARSFAQQFHFDLDDYRFVKFFFYLTPVDEATGPHVFVRGSHRGKSLEQLFPFPRRYRDAEVASWYRAEDVVSLMGKAGMGFLVDTFGVHKGETPREGSRLVLQLQFARRSYGFESDAVDERSLGMIELPT